MNFKFQTESFTIPGGKAEDLYLSCRALKAQEEIEEEILGNDLLMISKILNKGRTLFVHQDSIIKNFSEETL